VLGLVRAGGFALFVTAAGMAKPIPLTFDLACNGTLTAAQPYAKVEQPWGQTLAVDLHRMVYCVLVRLRPDATACAPEKILSVTSDTIAFAPLGGSDMTLNRRSGEFHRRWVLNPNDSFPATLDEAGTCQVAPFTGVPTESPRVERQTPTPAPAKPLLMRPPPKPLVLVPSNAI
jgi:hypothetical protein